MLKYAYYLDLDDCLTTVIYSGSTDMVMHAREPKFPHNSKGLLKKEANDAGYHTMHEYDALNRLSQLWHLDYDYWNIAGFQYAYNDANIVSKIEAYQKFTQTGALEHRTRNFTYDDVYRLKTEDRVQNGVSTWDVEYLYDAAGNREWAITPGDYDYYEYNDFNQLDYSESGSNPGLYRLFDLYGNQEQDIEFEPDSIADTVWEHNRDNRLTAVKKPLNLEEDDPFVAVVSYVYDSSGRLLLRTDQAGNKRKYYYDGINTLLTREKPDGVGTCYCTATANVLKNAAIAQIITQKQYSYATGNGTQSPTTEYAAYHYDHIGNVVAITDCDGYGTLHEAFDMEAFGTMLQGSQAGVRLTTKEYDPTGELYYFGARWYDPESGRWMEKEPLGLNVPNLYQFVFNSPIIKIDYNGKVITEMALAGCIKNVFSTIGGYVGGGPLPPTEGDDIASAICQCATGSVGGVVGGALGEGIGTLIGAPLAAGMAGPTCECFVKSLFESPEAAHNWAEWSTHFHP